MHCCMDYVPPLQPKKEVAASRARVAVSCIGPDNDASSFSGLGGTGVNTLIADPKYDLIGEDVHVWHT